MSSFPTCQLCHQQFSLKGPAPFLLPCLHAVCETCVTAAAGGVISCSPCQRDVNLTETPLQKDVVREKEILHLTVQHHPELVLCTLEDDGNQAVCWCRECEDFLCEHCQMIHGNFKATRKHAVQDTGELEPGGLKEDKYCSIHPRSLLDMWDGTCCNLICAKCKLGEHAEHKTVDFDEAAATAMKEVESLAKEIQSAADQLGSRLTAAEQDCNISDEQCNTLSENITYTFNNMKGLIDQREKELQITLQQYKEKVEREMRNTRNTSDVCQQRCQTTSDYINKTLTYSSRQDIMSLRQILKNKAGDCASSAHAIVHESPPLPSFNTDGLEKIKSDLAGCCAIATGDGPTVQKQVMDCGTQTQHWPSTTTECENLKQELNRLKASHDREIKSLRENLTRLKEKGLHRLKGDVSDLSFMIKCTHVELNKTSYNADMFHINKAGELINRPETGPRYRRLKTYVGPVSSAPLLKCESPQYWEVKALVEILWKQVRGLLLDIRLAREEEEDVHPLYYCLMVLYCSTHNSICRNICRDGQNINCLPDTLNNTPYTSALLHYGVVYDSTRSRIAFLDLTNNVIIGKIDSVDSSVALWPMLAAYNPNIVTVSMSLVVGSDIDLTESKKTLILKSLY